MTRRRTLDLPAALERLIRIAERSAFGPSTQAIIDEAVSRDIPWIRLDRHSLVQLGQGKYQQRIRATMTSRTSAIAVDIASDKSLTNQLLAAAGLPVPRSETVDTEDDAVTAARTIGYPVWSSRSTATTGGACAWTCAPRRTCARRSPSRMRESRGGDVVVETLRPWHRPPGAHHRRSAWWPSPSASPRVSRRTAPTPSRELVESRTATRGGASVTRRC